MLKVAVRWQQIRTSILVATCLSVFAVLGKSLLIPDTARDRPAPPPLAFPNSIPLTGWQAASSRSLDQIPNDPIAEQRLLSGHIYDYQRDDLTLQIQMYYTVDSSGNVLGFLRRYTSVPRSVAGASNRIERQQPGVGHYILFVHQQQAYLTSCINPRGGSTVTAPQFQRNRYTYDIRVDRLLRWLLFSDNIRDFRCLWVNMTIPLKAASPEAAYAVLEAVWTPWHQWWQPRFPEH